MPKLINPYPIIRKALFAMDAEDAHDKALQLFSKINQIPVLRRCLTQHVAQVPTTLMGLRLKNPVGLAAGLDKNGAYIDSLAQMGFGFIEVGTVTPKAQPGNPKPRLFRLPEKQCIINRMGFNNEGLDTFISNVQKSHYREQGGILGLNIGKNATTPIESALDDYLIGLRGVYPHADYITVNISSPNTKNLRSLQGGDELSKLLNALTEERLSLKEKHGRYVPIAVKIAPDLNEEEIADIAHVIKQSGIDGVIATNTTLSRDAVKGLEHADEAGGLSGPPVHAMSLAVIKKLREALGSDTAIIGVGGINSGIDALEKIQAGANAVQLYTGLIYQGPSLVSDCISSLKNMNHS